ncbi:MAG: hypothetical protein ACHQFX_07885 [Chitinophagales bacterium]
MKKKKIIIAVILVAITCGAWYGYKEYTRKVKDLSHVRARVQIKAFDLIAAFEKDETAANEKYLDKIIAVQGMVQSVEKNDKGYYSVVLGQGAMSSVRCSMDSAHQDDVLAFPPGTIVTMKGACTGFNADELLGADVILNRCVVEK